MKTNVEKVLERDQKLSELDDRADALQQGASQFEQQAGKLKRKFWLQNLKVTTLSTMIIAQYLIETIPLQMMIIMGVIGLIIVAYIGCEYRSVFRRSGNTRAFNLELSFRAFFMTHVRVNPNQIDNSSKPI